jgi:hypothetical protein
MKRLGRRFNEAAHGLLEQVQIVIGSPLWTFGTIVITIAWMLYERLTPHPIDNPAAGYPITILVYTLMTMWVENALKAQQSIQSRIQQEQMDRIEFLIQKIGERDSVMEQMLSTVKEQGQVIHQVVSVLNRTVSATYEIVSKEQTQ